MPADLGERRRDLRKSHAVPTEPIRHSKRGYTARDQCSPAIFAFENRPNDISDGLLFGVGSEVHPSPPCEIKRL